MARVGQRLPVAGGDQRRHAHVQAHGRARRRQGLGGNRVTGQDHIPVGSFPLDTDRLHPPLDWAVLMHPHVADALQPDERRGQVFRLGVPPAAVAVLGPLDCVEPAAPLEPGEPGRASGLDAEEERGERLVQPPQRGLLRGERPPALTPGVIGADVLEIGRLVAVPNAHARLAVGGAPVLQSGVVEDPVILKASGERGSLLAGGAQQEFERPAHTPTPSPTVIRTPRYWKAPTKPEAARNTSPPTCGRDGGSRTTWYPRS